MDSMLGGGTEILVRTLRELRALVEAQPFKGRGAGSAIKRYVVFLSRTPRRRPAFPLVSSKEVLKAIGMTSREVLVLSYRKPNGFFGFPNAFIEHELGVSATSRNWSTLTMIADFERCKADG